MNASNATSIYPLARLPSNQCLLREWRERGWLLQISTNIKPLSSGKGASGWAVNVSVVRKVAADLIPAALSRGSNIQLLWWFGAFSAVKSVQVSCISYQHAKRSENNLDVLKDFMQPFFDLHQPYGAFVHDCTPCHEAKTDKDFLQENKIPVLERPGNLPDLNLLENAWVHIKKHQSDLIKKWML